MFESVKEVAVLVATLLALAIGSIWYSPLFFGKQWMRSVGMTDADLEAAKGYMPRMFAAAVVVNLVALFVISQFVALSNTTGVPLSSITILLIALVGSFVASTVIWEGKSLTYWLVNVGYFAVVILEGVVVIGYWPW